MARLDRKRNSSVVPRRTGKRRCLERVCGTGKDVGAVGGVRNGVAGTVEVGHDDRRLSAKNLQNRVVETMHWDVLYSGHSRCQDDERCYRRIGCISKGDTWFCVHRSNSVEARKERDYW